MVAMNVWPTDAADGSVANEARWRKMARHWAATGVAALVGLELAPSLAGTNLTIRNGSAWVDGHFCELLSDQVLTVTANGLAVVRFDPAANTAELIYRDGVSVPAQSPTGVFEMAVAKITGSALTDVRRIVSPTGHNGIILTTSMSIGSNAANDIQWTAETADVDGWHAPSSPDVIVPPGRGDRYIVTATITVTGGSLGTLAAMSVMINGTTVYSIPFESAWFGGTITFVRTLNAGDVIKVQAYQSSGAARSLIGRLEIA